MKKLAYLFTALWMLSASPTVALPRIVGGETVPISKDGLSPAYPWMGSLQRNDAHECGATLIAPDYLLTAAHCFILTDLSSPTGYRFDTTGYRVRLGTRNYRDATAETIPVAEVVIHPDFRFIRGVLQNDVALLRLSRPSQSRNFIRLTTVEMPSGQIATAIGWGETVAESGQYSDLLQQVALPIVSREVCQQRLQDIYGPNIDSTNICAGLDAGGKDTCTGDSGGPLFIQDARGRYVQIGVTSFGYGCGRPLRPGVYANVAEVYSFIVKLIAQSTVEQTSSGQPQIVVANLRKLEQSALTPNQVAVAKTLDNINVSGSRDLTSVYIDLFLASDAKRQQAFESLMPRAALGQANLSNTFDRVIANHLFDRAAALNYAAQSGSRLPSVDLSGMRLDGKLDTTSSAALSLTDDPKRLGARNLETVATPIDTAPLQVGQSPTQPSSGPLNVFITGSINSGNMALLGAGERSDENLRSFTIGADYRLTPRTYLGLAFSRGSGETDEPNLSKLDTLSNGLTLYGMTQFGSRPRVGQQDGAGGYATGYLGYRWHRYETWRAIYLPQEIREASGEGNGQQLSAGMDVGWRFRTGQFVFGPSVRFRHSRINLEDYTETGAGGLALNLFDRTVVSSRGNLDLNAAYTIPLGWGSLMPSLRFGIEHEFGDGNQRISASFVDAPTLPFQISGSRFDRTWFVLNPGLTLRIGERATLGFSYQTDLLRSDSSNHSFSAGFRWQF
jgi:secreted trypsin-like serine protease/uncharacterized protein YhjY with autotransporter beta-barrel domain